MFTELLDAEKVIYSVSYFIVFYFILLPFATRCADIHHMKRVAKKAVSASILMKSFYSFYLQIKMR